MLHRPLTEEQILEWADAHRRRTGRWPNADAGPVAGAPGENWRALNRALMRGLRGLPSASSLARLLRQRRGRGKGERKAPLDVRRVLHWAEAHLRRTGRWPGIDSGAVAGEPGERWRAIDSALRAGCRGLPGGGSLLQLLRDSGGAVLLPGGRARGNGVDA
ncbi:MAG TPA: hypothetical protein VFE78_02380 [Gemmataceae bacterium]|jgi:hypothetical protein|nr:hypothetical protein [Gemmataceae bacterium]